MAGNNSIVAKLVLGLAHVAGMIDMVALPLWVGGLMQYYGLDPLQAGLTVTIFLLGAVLASVLVARRFGLMAHRRGAAFGFLVASICFVVMSLQAVGPQSFGILVALHAVAGVGTGYALSVTHGVIGRMNNPHAMFGMVNVALGVAGIAFFAGIPGALAAQGAQYLFVTFAGLTGLACIVSALAFPRPAPITKIEGVKRAMSREVWLIIGVIICMTFNQAMVFSFVERIGAFRGFSAGQVGGVLIALGFINLVPGALAAMLQKRLSPVSVGLGALVMQAVLALTLTQSITFAPYAVAGAVFVSLVIFTHTFLFGLLARLDRSGQAVSATPAMMMTGSSTGPVVGGALAAGFGYPALGIAACLVAALGITLLLVARRGVDAGQTQIATAPAV